MDFDRPSASDSAILADFLELQSRDPQFIHKRRQRAAGPIVLQGSTTSSTTNIPTGTDNRKCQCLRKRLECWGRIKRGFWTLIVLGIIFLSTVGGFVIHEVMADQAGQGANMQQIETLLQQMVAEQVEQRNRIAELGQAVVTSNAAVQGTQLTTEAVVTEVVNQVQQTFQQSQQAQQDQLQQLHQTQQDQLQQVSQALQSEQQTQGQQIQQLAQTLLGLQTHVQQQLQNVTNATIGAGPGGAQGGQSGSQQPPQPPDGGGCSGLPAPSSAQSVGANQAGATSGGTTNGGGNPGVNGPQSSPSGGIPLLTGSGIGIGGAPLGGIPSPLPASGGPVPIGSPTAAMSPAVAYAIQQGGVDNRALGKPTVFEPGGKVSFQDWSDHMITTCDSNMPGIYEVMEWIVNTQPKIPVDAAGMKVRFPRIDGLLMDYAETNIFAMLSTYTSGEAKNLVRQARRPHGFEAWRLLQVRFNPNTIGRQRAHLIKITNPAEGIGLDKLGAEIVSWENRICDFESRPGSDRIAESVKMAAIVQMCPSKLREHLQLNAGRFSTYLDIREEVFSYLDHVLPAAATAMDVGSLQTAGCWNCESTQHFQKNCPQAWKGGKKGKGQGGGKPNGKGKAGHGKDGKKGKGKGDGGKKGKKGDKGGKTKKGGDQVRSLNAVSNDPRLGQLQSAYAKAAVEAYQRERSVSGSQQVVPPPPSQVLPPSNSPTSGSPSQPLQSIGGLTLKSLFALSRSAARVIGSVLSNSRDFVESGEMGWRLRTMLAGSRMMDATVDSGAAASVCPPDTFAEYEQLSADDHQFFVAANGELVPELYKVQPVIATMEGQVRQTQFSVSHVNKVLISAAQICNRGHTFLLDSIDCESYIEDKETGERMKLYQKDGVYVQRFAVVNPDRMGFQGPAPWVVPTSY